MFDYSVLTVDVEALLLENEINLAKALDLLTFFSIQEKAKSQKIYPEIIGAQKKAICIRMMKAFEGQELPVKERWSPLLGQVGGWVKVYGLHGYAAS